MRVLLIYYTGTYNTRWLVGRVEERLLAEGNEVTRVEITSRTPPVPTEDYDLVGFAYPIYGFNAPLPFESYVKKLSFRPGQRFFIFKNSGETMAMNNASSRNLLRRMRRAQGVFMGEYHLVMPYNIHFRFEDDFVREILAYDRKLLEVMLTNLKNGTVERIESRPLYDLGAFFVGIQKIGGNVNSFFYRVDADKCTLCGKCVHECPHENIYKKDGTIRFSHHCDMCMRCSFFCPQDAIRIGFLEGWHVNGAYDLDALDAMGPPSRPYITKDSRGFYRCFIKYFAEIDRKYEALQREKAHR
ncbi:MAG: EFR1 family ferrodoxin [Clostridia bacterium]|nr:EFR1 family ferrodoxin [Clostridia bacterium]